MENSKEKSNASASPEEAEEALRRFVACHDGMSDTTNPPLAEQVPSSGQSAIRDQGMNWAIRAGSDAAIKAAARRGVSVSAVPVASVTMLRPVPVLGGDGRSGNSGAVVHERPVLDDDLSGSESPSSPDTPDSLDVEPTPPYSENLGDGNTKNSTAGNPIVIKALTLHLAAKARQIETFSRLISLGTRLDEPGTSVGSVRALIRLVTRGPDAAALLPLCFPDGANGKSTHFPRQLSQELRNEALMALLQGYKPPCSSQTPSLEDYLGYIRALLDAGASPDLVRRAALRSTSTLSIAASTLEPDLVRLLIYRGACPDGPPGLDPPLAPRLPLHVPLCAVTHAMAKSLLDPPVQAALRHIVDVLVAGRADINIHVPYRDSFSPDVSFTSPLVLFLDTVDCWDDDGGGPEALDALRFLLSRGADPNNPPRHPFHDPGGPLPYMPYLYIGQRACAGAVRTDPIADLLKIWGVGKLASPAFATALELLVGHPRTRGGVRKVADTLARHDHTIPTAQNDDRILAAWRRIISATARLLTPDDLGEFLHAYVVRKGTCPRHGAPDLWNHQSQADEIGDLARPTITELLAAGADVNHREIDSWRTTPLEDERRPTALHAICLWLAGKSYEEKTCNEWRPRCRGFRHTLRRAEFVRFLVEECGADGRMRYEGRTAAEILVQLRLPKVGKEEIGHGDWVVEDWVVEEGVARAGREVFVALLEKTPPPPPPPPPPLPSPPKSMCVCL